MSSERKAVDAVFSFGHSRIKAYREGGSSAERRMVVNGEPDWFVEDEDFTSGGMSECVAARDLWRAAPDLLAALESAVDAMEAADAYIKRGDYDGLPDEISEARAAIARAKGGAL